MSNPAPTLDQDEAMLARVAELDLSLAEKLHACAMAAQDPAEIASLARAYQKAARSLRQSIALRARLKRDARTPLRDTVEADARVASRAQAVRQAVTRVIHAETEHEAADWLTNVLEDRINLRVRDAAVDISTLDETIAEICEDLNLPRDTAERWRDLPQPGAAPPEPPRCGSG